MNQKIHRRHDLVLEMGKALIHREFFLEYQPQVDLFTGKVTGAEALVRWKRADGVIVSPAEFVHVAEETGLIHPLGQFITHEACAMRQRLESLGHGKIRLSINLSPRQFKHRDLLPLLESAIQRTGVDPQGLTFEITESSMLDDEEGAALILKRLQGLGVKLALDDFGTGYSSLSHLRLLPIDTLKMDRSFIREIAERRRDATMVNSMVTLAHSLGMDVVAEGVETVEQRDVLKATACDVVQGFLFSRPLSEKNFLEYLEKNER